MNTRNLQELYDEHVKNYPGLNAVMKIRSQLWKQYSDSDQYYIIKAADLLTDYGDMNAFIGHVPLSLNKLEQLEVELDHLSQKIQKSKYDDFLDAKPSKRLWALKKRIESFVENIQLMQLLIDSREQNSDVFVKCMQYVIANYCQDALIKAWKGEAEGDLVESIEQQFQSFVENKDALQQKIDELREQCKQVAGQLFDRTIKSDYVSDLQNAIYENKNEEKPATSTANHARLFQMNEQPEAVQQEAELKPGL